MLLISWVLLLSGTFSHGYSAVYSLFQKYTDDIHAGVSYLANISNWLIILILIAEKKKLAKLYKNFVESKIMHIFIFIAIIAAKY